MTIIARPGVSWVNTTLSSAIRISNKNSQRWICVGSNVTPEIGESTVMISVAPETVAPSI